MLMQLINQQKTDISSPDQKKGNYAQDKQLEIAKQKLKQESGHLHIAKSSTLGKTRQNNEKLGEVGKKISNPLNKTVSESQKDSHGAPPKLPLPQRHNLSQGGNPVVQDTSPKYDKPMIPILNLRQVETTNLNQE